MDRLSPQRRSWLMSRVKGKNTSPEVRVRRAAHALGLRFRLHRGDLPGTPDIVFRKHGVAIFVHGCFWHRHAKCKKATMPKTRTRFWKAKFRGNSERDRRAVAELRALGWKVRVIWECQTRDTQALERRLRRIFDIWD